MCISMLLIKLSLKELVSALSNYTDKANDFTLTKDALGCVTGMTYPNGETASAWYVIEK